MASNVKTLRPVAWIALIPQFLFMGLLISGYYLAGAKEFSLYGTFTYLVISYSSRHFILKDHRQGIALNKQEHFLEAIPYFQKSYDFFLKYAWIDQYRYLTLLTPAKFSYKEMALINIAFCYVQVKEDDMAKVYYNRVLAEYPGNEMAKAALDFLNSDEKKE